MPRGRQEGPQPSRGPAPVPPGGGAATGRCSRSARCGPDGRGWMPADRPPRCPGAGKGLVHDVLRRVLVADADQHGAQAFIPGPLVELREVRSSPSHTYSTHNPPAPADMLRQGYGHDMAPEPMIIPSEPDRGGRVIGEQPW